MIEGGLNFRDLGGVPIDARRRLRRDRLYRSGVMHALTNRGLESLSALGIRAVYDLRSDRERALRPPRLPRDGAVVHLYHAHERQTGNVLAALRDAGRTADDAKAIMLRIYRALPYEFVGPYRELFLQIADGPLPIVFNCAAGKDRTGVAAALILSALGVSSEEIYRDYLRSEESFSGIVEMFVSGPRGALIEGVDRAIWEPILRTDPDYLSTAFLSIQERHGSVSAYLRDALRIEAAQLRKINERLVESIKKT
jgi:protein-tyrosine phosphatase